MWHVLMCCQGVSQAAAAQQVDPGSPVLLVLVLRAAHLVVPHDPPQSLLLWENLRPRHVASIAAASAAPAAAVPPQLVVGLRALLQVPLQLLHLLLHQLVLLAELVDQLLLRLNLHFEGARQPLLRRQQLGVVLCRQQHLLLTPLLAQQLKGRALSLAHHLVFQLGDLLPLSIRQGTCLLLLLFQLLLGLHRLLRQVSQALLLLGQLGLEVILHGLECTTLSNVGACCCNQAQQAHHDADLASHTVTW
mmetsp:Transcript_4472/g.9612  ORF Transcript_4472/g.9612 Transcript_4472/m.9612 type:complete len:248 (-) Transcript_4472:491-1234(-)